MPSSLVGSGLKKDARLSESAVDSTAVKSSTARTCRAVEHPEHVSPRLQQPQQPPARHQEGRVSQKSPNQASPVFSGSDLHLNCGMAQTRLAFGSTGTRYDMTAGRATHRIARSSRCPYSVKHEPVWKVGAGREVWAEEAESR